MWKGRDTVVHWGASAPHKSAWRLGHPPKPVPAHPTMERGWPHMSKLPIVSPNDMMGFGVVGVMKTKQMAA